MNTNKKITEYRKSLQLSQEEFIKPMNVSRSYLASIEAGRQEPSFAFLQALFKAYPNISADWLLKGERDRAAEASNKLHIDIKPESYQIIKDALAKVKAAIRISGIANNKTGLDDYDVHSLAKLILAQLYAEGTGTPIDEVHSLLVNTLRAVDEKTE